MSDKYLEQFGMKIPENHPHPVGYRILLMPYGGPEKTQGGIILAPETQDAQKFGAMVAYVLETGPDVYTGEKFTNGSWCQKGEWVMIGKYAGSKFEVDGVEMRLLNDDEIIATCPDPSIVKRFSL